MIDTLLALSAAVILATPVPEANLASWRALEATLPHPAQGTMQMPTVALQPREAPCETG